MFLIRLFHSICAQYFPGNHYVMGFLHNVDHWLHTLPGWVSGSDWIEGLDKLKVSTSL